MLKKAVISFASASLVFVAVSCTTQVKAPGDISVDTRTVETKKEPGNILAEGRIDPQD